VKEYVHLCPSNSLFAGKVEEYARRRLEGVELYRASYKFFSLLDFLLLLRITRRLKGQTFVFHYVPSFAIYLLRIINVKLNYELIYWGDDYYIPILSQDRLMLHCVRKSPFYSTIVSTDQYFFSKTSRAARRAKRMLAYLKLYLALHVARSASCIYSSPKQYRYVRYVSFLKTRSSYFCERNRLLSFYAEIESHELIEEIPAQLTQIPWSEKSFLNVLVCHSGTSTVNVSHSLSMLSQMSKNRNCTIHVRGFLSYSGGGEADRNVLEKLYVEQAKTFTNFITFERRFLSSSELQDALDVIDLAFFSCYRDEGLTLLNMLARRSVPMVFNRFSINYDYFKSKGYRELYTHEQVVGLS